MSAVCQLFQQAEQSALGLAIQHSAWMMPALQSLHLLCLALLGGAVLMLDLRLLGKGLVSQPVPVIERQARPWLHAAALGLVVTGLLMLCSEATKLCGNPVFWSKMAGLSVAIAFAVCVRGMVARRDAPLGWLTRSVAVGSMSLWAAIALAGLWISVS